MARIAGLAVDSIPLSSVTAQTTTTPVDAVNKLMQLTGHWSSKQQMSLSV